MKWHATAALRLLGLIRLTHCYAEHRGVWDEVGGAHLFSVSARTFGVISDRDQKATFLGLVGLGILFLVLTTRSWGQYLGDSPWDPPRLQSVLLIHGTSPLLAFLLLRRNPGLMDWCLRRFPGWRAVLAVIAVVAISTVCMTVSVVKGSGAVSSALTVYVVSLVRWAGGQIMVAQVLVPLLGLVLNGLFLAFWVPQWVEYFQLKTKNPWSGIAAFGIWIIAGYVLRFLQNPDAYAHIVQLPMPWMAYSLFALANGIARSLLQGSLYVYYRSGWTVMAAYVLTELLSPVLMAQRPY